MILIRKEMRSSLTAKFHAEMLTSEALPIAVNELNGRGF